MARSVSPEQHSLDPQVAALRAHLAEIRNGVQHANESALAWKQKYTPLAVPLQPIEGSCAD